MVDFVRLASTASRLITANGREVTIVKFGNAAQDDTKPWRGRREYHAAEVVGYAAAVPESMVEDDDGVKRQGEFFLFSGADDDGYDLRDFDAIEDAGKVWKITDTKLLAPASTRVLYQFEVSR